MSEHDNEKKEKEIRDIIYECNRRKLFEDNKPTMFLQVGEVDQKGNVSQKKNTNSKHAIVYYSLGVWMPYGFRGETALGASKTVPLLVIGGNELFSFMTARFAKGYPTLPLLTIKEYMTLIKPEETAVGRVDIFNTKLLFYFMESLTESNQIKRVVALYFLYEKAEITHLNYDQNGNKHPTQFLLGVPGEPKKS